MVPYEKIIEDRGNWKKPGKLFTCNGADGRTPQLTGKYGPFNLFYHYIFVISLYKYPFTVDYSARLGHS